MPLSWRCEVTAILNSISAIYFTNRSLCSYTGFPDCIGAKYGLWPWYSRQHNSQHTRTVLYISTEGDKRIMYNAQTGAEKRLHVYGISSAELKHSYLLSRMVTDKQYKKPTSYNNVSAPHDSVPMNDPFHAFYAFSFQFTQQDRASFRYKFVSIYYAYTLHCCQQFFPTSIYVMV